MNERNAGLQIARAWACLGVLVGHAIYLTGILTDTKPPALWTRSTSALGVFLFFALSGYVMGLIFQSHRRPGAGSFLYHRVLRIYPPYWAAAALFYVAMIYLRRDLPPFDVTALLLSPVMVGNSTYGIPAWTLVYEMIFYLIIFSMLLARLSVSQATIAVVSWGVTIIGFALWVGQPYTHINPKGLILASPINLFFVVGFLVAVHDVKLEAMPTWALFAMATVLWLIGELHEPVNNRLVPTMYQAPACILFVLAFARLRPRTAVGATLVSIGNASYGIYLIHMIVMDVLVAQIWLYELKPPIWAAFAGLTVTALSAGWAFGLAEFSAYRWMTAKPRASAVNPQYTQGSRRRAEHRVSAGR